MVYQSQNNTANTVSKNIPKLRIKKGILQDRNSKDADLALNMVVKIETGESPNLLLRHWKKSPKYSAYRGWNCLNNYGKIT